jgi:hypothetical protein
MQNPKTPLSYHFSCIIALVYFTASYLLYCIVIYFIAFVIYFYLHLTPCAWQPLSGVGYARQGDCFAGCLTRTNRASMTVPREFDINPESPLWEKFSCYNTLHLESQRSGTLLSVINHSRKKTHKSHKCCQIKHHQDMIKDVGRNFIRGFTNSVICGWMDQQYKHANLKLRKLSESNFWFGPSCTKKSTIMSLHMEMCLEPNFTQ